MTPAPLLPGTPERVHATRVLVVAPHSDDEVIGCGGLVAQLADSGAAVRVLYLTDSGGGREAVGEREAYRATRREEAEAAGAVLGIQALEVLGVPDGHLAEELARAAEAIERELNDHRPDLVIAPSPLEVSDDHRAAFAALHRVLGNSGAAAPAAVLLYEVNHPGHPDLLVDVSAQAERIARAMACHKTQLARHPYGNAALGLRRFRTLSLGPQVELAEGYRRLDSEDFTTRSLAQLVGMLGGSADRFAVLEGPLVSVVVRTKDRPQLLAEALASLAAGQYRRTEVVLVNDGGAPPVVAADYPLPIVRVDLATNEGRAAAAQAGVEAAKGEFVAFLDDDDLAAPEHLATLVGLVSGSGVRVAYTDAAVAVYELEPEERGWVCRERRLPYSRDYDPDILLVDNYIPFNTLLIERGLLEQVGPLDRSLPFFEDWDLLIRLAALTPFHHLARVTCEYRHFRGGGASHVFGEQPRARADFLEVKARVLSKHVARLTPDALGRAVDRLRAEAVAAQEARRVERHELDRLTGDLARLAEAHQSLAHEHHAREIRYHALNGELVGLKQAHEDLRLQSRAEFESLQRQAAQDLAHAGQETQRLATEARRLYGEEARLRDAVEEQGRHLERTYAEIARLNELLEAMRSTRAWRLHEWWQRRAGRG